MAQSPKGSSTSPIYKKKDPKSKDGTKTEDQWAGPNTGRQLDVMQAIFGECLCGDAATLFTNSSKFPTAQFVLLDGIECISLGAVVDEQSARERVMRTVSQLITSTERLISVGYVKDGVPPSTNSTNGKQGEILKQFRKVTEVLPLNVWKRKNIEASKNPRRGGEFVFPLVIGSAIEYLTVRISHAIYLLFEIE